VAVIKKILIAVLILLVLVGVGVALFVSTSLDDLIAEQIEVQGSAALGSKVSVANVKTSLTNGSAVISGLTIANPDGYSTTNAIQISSFSAKVDYQNQLIEQISIDQPIINAEVANNKNNFQELLDNIPETEDTDQNTDDSNDVVLTIKQLAIRQATVNLRVEEKTVGDRTLKLEDQSFVMSDLVINNLSGTTDQLSEDITRRLTKHVSSQVQDFVAAQIKERVKEEIKSKAKEKVNELLEKKLGDKVGDKLKGLKFKLGN